MINKTVSVEEFNEIMETIEENNLPHTIEQLAFDVTVKYQDNQITIHCPLTGRQEDTICINAVAKEFYKSCKFDDLTGKFGYHKVWSRSPLEPRLNQVFQQDYSIEWDYKIACGYSYAEPLYSRKWLKCWSYDVNSAYNYAMLQRMPDTKAEPKYNSPIGDNEMGFWKNGMACLEKGVICDVVFPLMPSPFTQYVFDYYNKKKNATGAEKAKIKKILNIVTGLLARKNIFLRNAMIFYSNEYIKSYIDEDTVYVNVDSIVSLTPRPDIPLGEDIGQFKKEHECDNFKYIKSMIYQWNKECHCPGIKGAYIDDIENIKGWLQTIGDKLPYRFEKGRIIKNG